MSDSGLPKQFYDMLLDSQWWTAKQIRDYQRSQVGQLLRHAKANVPFYQGRLDAVVRVNGDVDWDRWAEIPIITRQDVVERGDAMLATTLPKGHEGLSRSTTSGTSGTPITLTSTHVAFIALNANRFRSYRWHEIDCAETLCAVVNDSAAAWPEGRIEGPWGPAWDADALDGAMISIDRTTPSEKLIEFLGRRGCKYLTAGPNRAFALALTAIKIGANLKMAAFLPHGEAVGNKARKAISEAFGARVIDLYSSKEAGHIAYLCPSGSGMHVNAETMLLEIVDEAGRPVAPGKTGRVVITPFFNAAQPLIRYDQGDVASWGPVCSCGRHLPVLAGVVGRSTTLFYHPDGRVQSSYLGMYRHLLNAEAWQIAQTGPTRFEVRYVPIDRQIPGSEREFAAVLRRAYFDDAEVAFHRVDSIPTTDYGKPREYVNEWEPEDRAPLASDPVE